MSSRQINFFLTAGDQAQLEQKLRAVGEYVVVGLICKDGRPVVLRDAVIKQMGTDRLTIYLVRPNDIRNVLCRELPTHANKVIDLVRSPVIEFARCYHAADGLRCGRFYVVTSYNGDEAVMQKERSFVEWISRTFTAARRALIRDPGSGDYFGPEASKLRNEGTKLLI